MEETAPGLLCEHSRRHPEWGGIIINIKMNNLLSSSNPLKEVYFWKESGQRFSQNSPRNCGGDGGDLLLRPRGISTSGDGRQVIVQQSRAKAPRAAKLVWSGMIYASIDMLKRRACARFYKSSTWRIGMLCPANNKTASNIHISASFEMKLVVVAL